MHGSISTARTAVDPAVAQELAENVLAAWNSHQADRLLALMTDDVVFDDASLPAPLRGHDAVREFAESSWRAVPDLTFELPEGTLIDPATPRIMFYWRAHATQTGMWDPPGLAPTGRRIDFEGVDYYELRDGKVCRARSFYDVARILRQLGVLPEPGARGERLMMAAANLRTRLRRR